MNTSDPESTHPFYNPVLPEYRTNQEFLGMYNKITVVRRSKLTHIKTMQPT